MCTSQIIGFILLGIICLSIFIFMCIDIGFKNACFLVFGIGGATSLIVLTVLLIDGKFC